MVVRNLWVYLLGDTGLWLTEGVDFSPFDCARWKSFHDVPGVVLLRQHYCFDLHLFVALGLENLGTSLSALSASSIYHRTGYCESFGEGCIYRLNFGIIFNNCVRWTWSLRSVLSLKLAGSRFQSSLIVHLWDEVNFQSSTDSFYCCLDLLLENKSLFAIASEILRPGSFQCFLCSLLSRRADLSWFSRALFYTR